MDRAAPQSPGTLFRHGRFRLHRARTSTDFTHCQNVHLYSMGQRNCANDLTLIEDKKPDSGEAVLASLARSATSSSYAMQTGGILMLCCGLYAACIEV